MRCAVRRITCDTLRIVNSAAVYARRTSALNIWGSLPVVGERSQPCVIRNWNGRCRWRRSQRDAQRAYVDMSGPSSLMHSIGCCPLGTTASPRGCHTAMSHAIFRRRSMESSIVWSVQPVGIHTPVQARCHQVGPTSTDARRSMLNRTPSCSAQLLIVSIPASPQPVHA